MGFSILNTFALNAVDLVETPRWILALVCVIGVVLACVTDEGYSLLYDDEGGFKPKSVISPIKSEKLTSTKGSHLATVLVRAYRVISGWSSLCLIMLQTYLPEFTVDKLRSVGFRCTKIINKIQLLREGYYLKRLARTKRQFFYMLEKRSLNIPVIPGETEIDSYLDCKTALKNIWPFMWEVANVKDTKIKCCNIDCVPMSSYSYLDLIRDTRVQTAAIEAAKEWSTGNHGPRMLGGNTRILGQLEKVISKFFNREDTILCATGYLACMSACAAVSNEATVTFCDSRLHASLRAGLKIGEGKTVIFKHNDFADCEAKMKKFRHKYLDAWVVLESVYSMDGDLCDLPKAYELCKKYNVNLMIDEAHGLGVIGKTGRGVEEHFNMQGCATVIVGTFSKSIACIGGYITGPRRFISYLDFHAPGNVFSAPLPAYCAGGAIKSFQLIDEHPEMITKAQTMSKLLRSKLESGAGHWPHGYPESLKYIVEGDPASTVIAVIFPDDLDRVLRISIRVRNKGYMCSAVGYPACPLRRPRFRLTATAAYTPELIDEFVKVFVESCIEEKRTDFTLSF